MENQVDSSALRIIQKLLKNWRLQLQPLLHASEMYFATF